MERGDFFKLYSHSGKATDSGSPESQIAVSTYHIKSLTEHIKQNPKDKVSKRTLLKYVNKRNNMLKYLKSRSMDRCEVITKKLESIK